MNTLFVLVGIGVAALLAEIINYRKGLSFLLSTGLVAGVYLMLRDWNLSLRHYHDMVVFDNTAIAFTSLISIVGLFWIIISRKYLREDNYKTDRSALFVFAIIGAVLMVSFNNMSILFLGIEILSICMYVLAGSRKNSIISNEAAFKYFLMGSFATGFLLFGVALVYGATGTFDLTVLGKLLAGNPALPKFFYAGVVLIFVGMAFKMSAVPFHFWAPDVYEGSPTNITAFMATVVKIASVGAFFKVFGICFASINYPSLWMMQVILVLTLVVGNISAVLQENVKRILAFSSIGHIGYILLAMVADKSADGIIYYYLTAYSFATLSAFAVIARVEKHTNSTSLKNFTGLVSSNPLLTVVMIISLLSLAGIPPLAGFFGKYLVFAKAIEQGYLVLVLIGVVASLIGVYYYFRIITTMVTGSEPTSEKITNSWEDRAVFLLLATVNILLGLFPESIIALLQ